MTNKNSYRDILKTTSLFSGVQVLNVLISIVKSKLAAILIGPAGIGILGLLNSTLNVIVGLSKLGLDVSAVKEISALNEKNKSRAIKIIDVLRRLCWITGLLGAVITFVFSSWLSKLTFGDSSHTTSFMLLSFAVLFNQLTVGNLAILQGLRKLKRLAKASLWGSFFSLIVIIPLYYYYGIEGIVPAIILISVFTYFFSWLYAKKEFVNQSKLSLKETLSEGKSMIKLGFVLSLGSLATILTIFAIQIFITNKGGVDEVGFYNAAFIVINAYVGVIFTAMSKDYFPRLSSVVNEQVEMLKVVNQQAYIAVLLLTPIIVIFLAFIPTIISILFTKEFIPIIGILTFGILATLFKAVSWSMGFILVAKGDSKLYIKTEVGFNVLLLLISAFGYIYGGLTGVGMSYLVYYIIYLIGIKIITNSKYKFKFENEFYQVFLICMVLCLGAFYATYFDSLYLKYGILFVFIVASIIFSINRLDKKTDLIKELKQRITKNK
ncbi:oligosaccharide flippase family protein [Pontimicrobium sp. SW4]|uniref:Oligosaccharide flippase family protein n=1 Tax=Pontimicrobium sp. SW4 TaxID=3153519 RepID=A0AAU7BQ17_9FLAO